MSVARHVTQILHNEEVGPEEVELLMSKLKQVLVKKAQMRAFISLVQTIEDRSDPQSKYHDKTIDKILESFGVAERLIIENPRDTTSLDSVVLSPRNQVQKQVDFHHRFCHESLSCEGVNYHLEP